MPEGEKDTGQEGRHTWLISTGSIALQPVCDYETQNLPCPLCHPLLWLFSCVSPPSFTAMMVRLRDAGRSCFHEAIAPCACFHTCIGFSIFWPFLYFLPAHCTWSWLLSHVLKFRTNDPSTLDIKLKDLYSAFSPTACL